MVQLDAVYLPPKTKIEADIVFIHGLDGDRYATWTCDQPGCDGERYWPRWLARDFPQCAVWTIGYEAPYSGWQNTKQAQPVYDRALTILDRLDNHPDFTQNRPIVFVCHSMGGLLLKEALHIAHEPANTYHWVADHIAGICFLATPHDGSDVATYTRYLKLLRPTIAVADLEAHAPHLRGHCQLEPAVWEPGGMQARLA